DSRNKPRAAAPASLPALNAQLAAAPPCSPSQDISAEIGIFSEVSHVLIHVGRVDLDCFPGAVGRAERNIVKHPLHQRLQAAAAPPPAEGGGRRYSGRLSDPPLPHRRPRRSHPRKIPD